MADEYDVRIWALKPRKNKHGKVTSYSVRWKVGAEEFFESVKGYASADSLRATLMSAQKRGEPFDSVTGRPLSEARTHRSMDWFTLATAYVDLHWPEAAPTARQTMAEALIRVTPVFLEQGRGKPEEKEIRSALRGWAFNTAKRDRTYEPPEHLREAIQWCARNSKPVSLASEPQALRALQKAVTTRLNGGKYAPSVAKKTRSILSSVLDYAVEVKALGENPLSSTKWTSMPKGNRTVDPRAVPNPVQARTMLAAVREVERSGPRLEAFFGTMYFAALRPEEVVGLRESNLKLPSKGWGEIYIEDAHPHAGSHWTGTGNPRDVRSLKARNAGEGRPVPCPPELVEMLRRHLDTYAAPDGQVFTGEKGGQVPLISYTRVWRAARSRAFTRDVHASPLARRPYDLRHAAVSTWLAAGVPPTTVARWAGHSVAVLLEIYASCLHGGDVIAQQQVQRALGHD